MRNFKAEEQISNLGLENIARASQQLSMLDIGCGRTMELVRYLQSKGHKAEGLDLCEGQENYPGLIKQHITEVYPREGCIPREANSYDLIFAHQNYVFNEALTLARNSNRLRSYENFNESWLLEQTILAEKMISEAVRVVKREGVIIVYPRLDLLSTILGSFIANKKLRVSHTPLEELPNELKLMSFIWGVPDSLKGMFERTAIYYDETNADIKKKLKI